MSPPRLHPAARDELAAAAAWYEERRPGYGAVFLARVGAVVRFVEAAPSSGTPWAEGPVRT